MSTKQSAYDRYMQTYSGKQLLEKYPLSQEGTWQIRGEDPNCDLGGHHYQPDLGLVQGKLQDIIEYAVDLNGFWQWGSGGDIKLIDPPKKINPDANKQRKILQDQLVAAEAEVAAIAAKLKAL